MTNTLAIIFAVLIAALFAFDYVQYDWANTIFVFRKFVGLIEWMAFWR
jgi:hypothetical protein